MYNMGNVFKRKENKYKKIEGNTATILHVGSTANISVSSIAIWR
jgi:hypothetical protein